MPFGKATARGVPVSDGERGGSCGGRAMEVENVRGLLQVLGTLTIAVSGMLIMTGARRLGVRLLLLGCFLAAVSAIVQPSWLPP